MLYFEDLRLDEPVIIGGTRVTADDIRTFARRYDPQRIHLDDDYARTTIVGGLCASGFHTCCLMMRMLCDGFLLRAASLGAPGLDEVKWLKPVRPDDVLRVRILATEKRVMASRPNVGLVRSEYDVLNQADDVVMTSVCRQIVRLRTPQPVTQAERADKPSPAHRHDLWDRPLTDTPRSSGLYFEERTIGETKLLGAHTFARDEVIAFARLYDPQPFHLDEAAAKASLFGGLAASGWHTACHFIRLVVADRQAEEAALRAAGKPVPAYGPSPGFRNLRWVKPVMVGDTLEYRNRVIAKIDLKSRPERGILQSITQARNQHGALVFEHEGAILVERKTPWRAPA
jgi:acyl dehydratase